MKTISFQETEISVADGQSVLEALVQSGCHIPHSCNAGACQSCLMRCVKGSLPGDAQQGVKEALRAQGYFLACRCIPEDDLELVLPANDTRLRSEVIVTEHEKLTHDVVRIRLRMRQPFTYYPGQYVTLWKDDKLGRSYSLASVPFYDHDDLEIHVKKMPGGKMSEWLYNHLEYGAKLMVQGPAGDCFYTPGFAEQKMLMMGTGAGVAPLYGIARDALLRGHKGEIHLYHGTRDKQGLYLAQQFFDMAKEFANFHYHPACMDQSQGIYHGAVGDYALNTIGDMTDWRVFLCGAEEFVNEMRRRCYLAGASPCDIFADAFMLQRYR